LDLSLGVWGRVSSQDVAKGADKDFRKQAMQFTSSSLTATCQLCAVSLGDFQWQDSEHQRHDSSWMDWCGAWVLGIISLLQHQSCNAFILERFSGKYSAVLHFVKG
jgi:hypothetical protein